MKIIEALVSMPHEITDAEVVIRFNPRKPGHNALNQLLKRIEEAISPSSPIRAGEETA